MVLNPDGTFTYTPDPDWNGTDTFTYVATDLHLYSAPATVTVQVHPANDAPTCTGPVPVSVMEDGTENGDASLHCTDLEPDLLTYSEALLGGPLNGTLVVNSDGTFVYQPDPDYNGSDSFSIQASDGTETATVTFDVSVTPVNDAGPVGTADHYTTSEDVPYVSSPDSVLINDTDIDEDSLLAVFASDPAFGSLTMLGDGTFTYAPDPDFNGTDVFTYHVSDGTTISAPVPVTITVLAVNDDPVCDATATLELRRGRLGIRRPRRRVHRHRRRSAGLCRIGAPVERVDRNLRGTFTYTPDGDYFGADVFTVEVSDGAGGTDSVEVDVTVHAVNDAPTYTSLSNGVIVGEDSAPLSMAYATDISTGPANESGQLLEFQVVASEPTLFSVPPAVDATTGQLTWTLTPNAHGSATLHITLRDDGGTDHGGIDETTSHAFEVIVTPVDDGPVAVDDDVEVSEDSLENAFNVLLNDEDVDTTTVTITAVSVAAHGDVIIPASGTTIRYTPDADFVGTDSFTYTISDGNTTDTATVNITILQVNDAPSFQAGGDVSVDEDSGIHTGHHWASDISVGPANESGQVPSFEVSSDNPSLFASGPSVDADGTLSFTPALNAHGSATVSVTIEDDGGTLSGGADTGNTVSFTVTVNPVNDAPACPASTSITRNEDSGSIEGLWNFICSDVEGDTLTFTVDVPPASVGIDQDPSGSFTITLPTDFNGSDSIFIEASDGNGGTDTFEVLLTIDPVNDAPIVTNDTNSGDEDGGPILGHLSGNGSDIDGDDLTFAVDGDPSDGTLTLNANGTYSYTPDPDFNGTDSFTYVANDGTTNSAPATVTITVGPVNDAPVADNDVNSGNEDGGAINGDVSLNDSDVDEDELTFTLVDDVGHGDLTLNPNGTYSYVPGLHFHGVVSFTYRANDGLLDSATATVTITVASVNDAPIVTDDTNSGNEDEGPFNGDLSANASDVDGDEVILAVDTAPSHGTLVLAPYGTYSYTPDPDFNGTDSFTYKANDYQADSAPATVTITVHPVNDAPVAVDDDAAVNEDSVDNDVTVLVNDTDIDSETITITGVGVAAHGDVTIPVGGGSVRYTPNADYNGPDSFTYTISDGGLTSTATVNVIVRAVNDAPSFVAGSSIAVEEDRAPYTAPGWATVIVGPADESAQVPSFTVTTSNDSLFTAGPSVGSDGTLTFTPTPDAHGVATVTVTITDDGGTDFGGDDTGNTAQFTITVEPVNDAPVCSGTQTINWNEDEGPITGNWSLVCSDVDGDSLTFGIDTLPTHIVVTQDPAGPYSYSLPLNYNGTDTLVMGASDNNGGEDTFNVVVNIAPINDAPVVTNDTNSGDEDGAPIHGDLSTNGSDVDDDPLTFAVVDDVADGTLTFNPNGTYTYEPDPDFNGTDSFTYQANDGTADSAPATVTITVVSVNDAPVCTTPPTITVDEDVMVGPFDMNDHCTDVDGDDLTLSVLQPFSVANGISTETGWIMAFFPQDWNGTDTAIFTAFDGNALSGTALGNWVTVTIVVTPVNDAPVVTGDTNSGDEDGAPIHGDLSTNGSDVDLDPLTFAVVDDVADGTLTFNPNGTTPTSRTRTSTAPTPSPTRRTTARPTRRPRR